MEAEHFTNYVHVIPTPMTVKILREVLAAYDDDLVVVVKESAEYGGGYIAADVVHVDTRDYYVQAEDGNGTYEKRSGETIEIT